jgi:hypothetical protein
MDTDKLNRAVELKIRIGNLRDALRSADRFIPACEFQTGHTYRLGYVSVGARAAMRMLAISDLQAQLEAAEMEFEEL